MADEPSAIEHGAQLLAEKAVGALRDRMSAEDYQAVYDFAVAYWRGVLEDVRKARPGCLSIGSRAVTLLSRTVSTRC